MWCSDRSDFELTEGVVDLWRIQSSLPCYQSPSLFHCLSKEEQERAARFHFEKDRLSYRVTHACKRWILANYLGVEPDALCFSTGEWGKPSLEQAMNDRELRFNLSHSKGITVIGVSQRDEIGVDVEGLQSAERMVPIFDRFASESEKLAFGGLHPKDHGRWMTAWWVSKEAYIKAVGRGLSLGLSCFSVDVRSCSAWGFAEMPAEFGEGRDYQLRLLDLGLEFFGAVAVRRDDLVIRGYSGESFVSGIY